MHVKHIINGISERGFEWKGGPTRNLQNHQLVHPFPAPSNYRQIWWVEAASRAARSVARVALPNAAATGFLIGEDTLITNLHVIEDRYDAGTAEVQFNYRLCQDGERKETSLWRCDPDSVIKSKKLDFSLVKLLRNEGRSAGEEWGYFDLEKEVGRARVDHRANIIHYPEGRFQQLSFRDNQIRFAGKKELHYTAGTDPGSSGAPVFDDNFRLIGIHAQRKPDPALPEVSWLNQGVSFAAILKELKKRGIDPT